MVEMCNRQALLHDEALSNLTLRRMTKIYVEECLNVKNVFRLGTVRARDEP